MYCRPRHCWGPALFLFDRVKRECAPTADGPTLAVQPQVGERSGGQTVQGVKAVKPGGICALFIQRGPVDITAQPAAGAAPPQDDHPGPAGPPLIFQPDGVPVDPKADT